MSTMGVRLEASETGRGDTKIIVNGVDLASSANAYNLSSKANSITELNINLIALRPMVVEGDMEVSIGIDEIPEDLAREIYRKLKKRFSKDRLKRKLKT